MALGERVQVDHMTVTKNGITCKHFQAWERRSKCSHAQVSSNAKASSAKRFLMELVEQTPFEIISIQVDGGSEFMAEFKTACEEMSMPLEVLPPSRPTYNGGVERGNRSFREEFYYRRDLLADSIGTMRFKLKKALNKYNTYRPHQSLGELTPHGFYSEYLHPGMLWSLISPGPLHIIFSARRNSGRTKFAPTWKNGTRILTPKWRRSCTCTKRS